MCGCPIPYGATRDEAKDAVEPLALLVIADWKQ
jgi:hypothetical protein